MKLSFDTYSLNAIELAQKLLGMSICRNIDGKIVKLKIIETEAYYGENDTACHAHKGKTKRTEIMYERGGFAYVYLCYGIHNMLNIVSGQQGHPEAVLIRGIENFDGPGKLTKALLIDRSLNGENLVTSNKLWIENTLDDIKPTYIKLKRVGIDYATEEYRNKVWRFKILNSKT